MRRGIQGIAARFLRSGSMTGRYGVVADFGCLPPCGGAAPTDDVVRRLRRQTAGEGMTAERAELCRVSRGVR